MSSIRGELEGPAADATDASSPIVSDLEDCSARGNEPEGGNRLRSDLHYKRSIVLCGRSFTTLQTYSFMTNTYVLMALMHDCDAECIFPWPLTNPCAIPD